MNKNNQRKRQATVIDLKTRNWLKGLAEDAKPDIDECIEFLGDQIEWLYQLKDTPQDPEWHGEGNVYIHTRWVLKELYCLLDDKARHIEGDNRQSLILAALLHDIGKPVRTKNIEICGVLRVASPQHESVGRSYLAFKLMGFGLPFKVVWTVLGLVGEHHMPKLLVVKNKGQSDYLALSRRADVELLFWLEVADMRGRICPDLDAQLVHLEEFKMFSEEYGVWRNTHNLKAEFHKLFTDESDREKDYTYANALYDLENNRISMPEEAIARTFSNRKKYSNFLVLCGPSGAGKSSWVDKHCKDFALISLDDIRDEINGCRTSQKSRGQVLQLAKERLKACLRNQQDVIWDATNLRSDFRKILCDLGRDYKALVSIISFILPEKTLFNSNSGRDYAVPEDVLIKQINGYQFPLVSEAHRMSIIGENGKLLYRSGYFGFYENNFSDDDFNGN